jgi:hypothetical protein
MGRQPPSEGEGVLVEFDIRCHHGEIGHGHASGLFGRPPLGHIDHRSVGPCDDVGKGCRQRYDDGDARVQRSADLPESLLVGSHYGRGSPFCLEFRITLAHRPPGGSHTVRVMSVREAQPQDAAEVTDIHVRSWQVAYRGLFPARRAASRGPHGPLHIR